MIELEGFKCFREFVHTEEGKSSHFSIGYSKYVVRIRLPFWLHDRSRKAYSDGALQFFSNAVAHDSISGTETLTSFRIRGIRRTTCSSSDQETISDE